MSTDGHEGFFLTYELHPDDLAEPQAASPRSRRRRARLGIGLVAWLVVGAALMAFTRALGRSAAVSRSFDTRSSLIFLGCLIGTGAAYSGLLLWRLQPERRARRIWRAVPRLRGIHHDQVDSRGVTWTAPDGVETFIPWSKLVAVHETHRAFHLIDGNGGALVSLPKRGLPDDDLIPPLRNYLNRLIGGESPANVTPDAARKFTE